MEAGSYKCPNCGAPLRFDSATQKMACDSCGSSFDIETLEKLECAQTDTSTGTWEAYGSESGSGDWSAGETENMRVYSCSSCGAEIVADAVTAATRCPYCDNEVIFTSQLSGMFRPDYVIPFKISAEQAKEALKEQCRGKKLLPKNFITEHRIQEIKGVYVPFWLFDCDVYGSVDYNATRVRAWSDSKYNYTETSYYLIEREGRMTFDKLPVDGSTHMDDTYMEAVEPYDYREIEDFATPYLSGFLAEKYDVTAEQAAPRADQRVKTSTLDAISSTVNGYATVTKRRSALKMENGKAHYALMPVWMLSTQYEGKNYMFAMNGQTGRFIGRLPVSKSRSWLWRLGITAGLTAIIYLILSLF